MNLAVEKHFVGKVAQKAVIIKDSCVLLVRDSRVKDEIWELPGGRLNDAEEPRAGLVREIKEELGVDVLVNDVVHLEQFIQGKEGERALMIAYLAETVNKEAEFVLDQKEVAEAHYVPFLEALELKMFPEYKRTLEVFLKNYEWKT